MKTLLSIVAACAPVACAQTETTTVEAPVSDRVVIGLDGQGVPHVRASSREDATYALGYLHGRDRFFQMDLSRRYASGRLAELAGPAMLSGDVQRRMWNFEAVAAEVIADLSETERSLADAYARGVNDGLASLPTRPPEYFFVGAEPEPWTVESSVMTTFSLVEQLSGGGWDERWNDSASKALPAELFAFLHPKGGRLDAPIDGSSVALAPIPGADIVDLRTALPDWPTDDKQTNALDVRRDFVTRGSNNWAVGADRTADGAAILATDPHLGLQLPNVWYRARLEWTCPDGIDHDVVGITLPGFPVVIMGSNGHLAWGMTNVHGDFQDSVVLPDGYETTTREETFVVRGQADETRTFEDTEWGPVVELNDNEGRRIASRWTGAMPEA
ncbi:MAG: penicillin acylase family protein, partial [Planctomycetota bacterium]